MSRIEKNIGKIGEKIHVVSSSSENKAKELAKQFYRFNSKEDTQEKQESSEIMRRRGKVLKVGYQGIFGVSDMPSQWRTIPMSKVLKQIQETDPNLHPNHVEPRWQLWVGTKCMTDNQAKQFGDTLGIPRFGYMSRSQRFEEQSSLKSNVTLGMGEYNRESGGEHSEIHRVDALYLAVLRKDGEGVIPGKIIDPVSLLYKNVEHVILTRGEEVQSGQRKGDEPFTPEQFSVYMNNMAAAEEIHRELRGNTLVRMDFNEENIKIETKVDQDTFNSILEVAGKIEKKYNITYIGKFHPNLLAKEFFLLGGKLRPLMEKSIPLQGGFLSREEFKQIHGERTLEESSKREFSVFSSEMLADAFIGIFGKIGKQARCDLVKAIKASKGEDTASDTTWQQDLEYFSNHVREYIKGLAKLNVQVLAEAYAEFGKFGYFLGKSLRRHRKGFSRDESLQMKEAILSLPAEKLEEMKKAISADTGKENVDLLKHIQQSLQPLTRITSTNKLPDEVADAYFAEDQSTFKEIEQGIVSSKGLDPEEADHLMNISIDRLPKVLSVEGYNKQVKEIRTKFIALTRIKDTGLVVRDVATAFSVDSDLPGDIKKEIKGLDPEVADCVVDLVIERIPKDDKYKSNVEQTKVYFGRLKKIGDTEVTYEQFANFFFDTHKPAQTIEENKGTPIDAIDKGGGLSEKDIEGIESIIKFDIKSPRLKDKKDEIEKTIRKNIRKQDATGKEYIEYAHKFLELLRTSEGCKKSLSDYYAYKVVTKGKFPEKMEKLLQEVREGTEVLMKRIMEATKNEKFDNQRDDFKRRLKKHLVSNFNQDEKAIDKLPPAKLLRRYYRLLTEKSSNTDDE